MVCAGVMSDTKVPAPRRHQEVEVPDLGAQAIVREVGDRCELAEDCASLRSSER